MSELATGDAPPPPFGDSYAKARKAYGLSSALLLAWALIGIEIDPKPIDALQISLKSPQAAPYVLIALVAYFAFHFTVEWYQAAASRRRLRASQVDFIVAHSIGTAALTLFGVQSVFRIQIANVITPGTFWLFAFGLAIGSSILSATFLVRSAHEVGWDSVSVALAIGTVLLAILPAIAAVLITSPLSGMMRLLILAGGGVAAGLIYMVNRSFQNKLMRFGLEVARRRNRR
jgi:small-conductance mechanosensitive channel